MVKTFAKKSRSSEMKFARWHFRPLKSANKTILFLLHDGTKCVLSLFSCLLVSLSDSPSVRPFVHSAVLEVTENERFVSMTKDKIDCIVCNGLHRVVIFGLLDPFSYTDYNFIFVTWKEKRHFI